MKLWICGQLKSKWNGSLTPWEFQGVFSTKEKATAACRDKNYCIFSAMLDEELPHESIMPLDGIYPVLVEQTIQGTTSSAL